METPLNMCEAFESIYVKDGHTTSRCKLTRSYTQVRLLLKHESTKDLKDMIIIIFTYQLQPSDMHP